MCTVDESAVVRMASSAIGWLITEVAMIAIVVEAEKPRTPTIRSSVLISKTVFIGVDSKHSSMLTNLR